MYPPSATRKLAAATALVVVVMTASARTLGNFFARRERSLINNGDGIGVELQDGSRNLRGDGTEEDVTHDLRLVFAAYNQKNLLGSHDGSNAHGVRLAGHFVCGIEQAAVRIDGAFRQIDAVGFLGEFISRLVEADVPVVTKTEKLQVNAARQGNGGFVGIACGLGVGVGAVRDMRVFRTDVHMVEQMLLHEVMIALLVIVRKAAIFVKIKRGDAGEIEVFLFVALNELGIQALGRRTRGKAEHATGLFGNQFRNDIRSRFAHILIIFSNDDLHRNPFRIVRTRRIFIRRLYAAFAYRPIMTNEQERLKQNEKSHGIIRALGGMHANGTNREGKLRKAL